MGGAAFFHLVSPFLRLYALVGMVLAAKRQRSVKEAAHQGTVGKRHQTQEGIIQQKLRDNFKHLGPSETDVVKGPDGRTLRERLQHDFNLSKQGVQIVFGRIYYDMLRGIYQKQSAQHLALELASAEQVVSAELVQAMLAAKKIKPDRQPFVTWMSKQSMPPNPKEVAGIFRWLLTLRIGCVKQMGCAMKGF